MRIENLVVGTGPSGVAAIATIIAKGGKPTVIDGGIIPKKISIEKSSAKSVQSSPGQKSWFGSFSSFEQNSENIEYSTNFQARASYSFGGLSRVWGATYEFYKGIREWNSSIVPLQEDYNLVHSLLPNATTSFESNSSTSLQGNFLSGKIYLSAINQNIKNSWHLRPSTLAVETDKHKRNHCIGCTLCLSGCPQDSIWFSGNLIRAWVETGQIDYLPGFVVDNFREEMNQVTVNGKQNGKHNSLYCRNLFLATGAISTAAIVIKSGIRDSVTIPDTSTAFLAGISWKQSSKKNSNHHGLSQWWATNKDATTAFQIYPPDVIHASKILKDFHLPIFLTPFIKHLLRHVHPIIAYQSQENSSSILVNKNREIVQVSGVNTKNSIKSFKKKLKVFSIFMRKSGLIIPISLTSFSQPGAGYHFGSSFAHGAETDNLGRLHNLKKVFIVDSSVLPNLEVGSITPTVMVNAARIVRSAIEE